MLLEHGTAFWGAQGVLMIFFFNPKVLRTTVRNIYKLISGVRDFSSHTHCIAPNF